MRCQTYGYLSSCRASLPVGWYKIILLGDRGTCALTTCPGLHSTSERPGFEPATCRLQVQHSNHSATEPHIRPAEKSYPSNPQRFFLWVPSQIGVNSGKQTSSLSPRLNGHFPGGPGLAGTRTSQFWILLELRMMQVLVITGAVRRAKLQPNRNQQTNTQFFTGQMP